MKYENDMTFNEFKKANDFENTVMYSDNWDWTWDRRYHILMHFKKKFYSMVGPIDSRFDILDL
jgi:hypothetical protein